MKYLKLPNLNLNMSSSKSEWMFNVRVVCKVSQQGRVLADSSGIRWEYWKVCRMKKGATSKLVHSDHKQHDNLVYLWCNTYFKFKLKKQSFRRINNEEQKHLTQMVLFSYINVQEMHLRDQFKSSIGQKHSRFECKSILLLTNLNKTFHIICSLFEQTFKVYINYPTGALPSSN